MKRLSSRGFTILETLIVLAIAGLILLVVLFAVPALNRNQRNTSQKAFITYVAGALDEYKIQMGPGATYPDTPAAMCNFMNNYLKKRAGGQGTCNPSYGSPGACVRLKAGTYTICFHDRDGAPHSYVGAADEISIQLSHWCTPKPNPWPEDDGNPITSGDSTTDTALYYYVIWSKVEPSGLVCRDNHGS